MHKSVAFLTARGCFSKGGVFGFGKIKVHHGRNVGKALGFESLSQPSNELAIFVSFCEIGWLWKRAESFICEFLLVADASSFAAGHYVTRAPSRDGIDALTW